MAKKFGLQARISAKDEFSGPLKRMGKDVHKFSRKSKRRIGSVGDSFRRLKGVATGAVAALGAAKVAQGVTQFANMATEVNELSKRLGVTTSTLQELQFAAEKYGVQQEALRDGLKEMSMRADEFAQTGAGPAAEAMERLGLSQQEINKRKGDTEALFNLMLSKIREVEDTAARQRIADEIFGGTGGEQLVDMAAASAEELSRLRQEARDLGFVISKDTLEASEAFKDSLTDGKAVMRALGQIIMSRLLPAIQPMIENMSEWIAANKDLIKQRIDQTLEAIRKAARFLANQWRSGTIPALLAGTAAFKGVTLAITGAQGLIPAIKRIKSAMAAGSILKLANPWSAIAAAVVGAAVLIIKNWDKVKALFANIGKLFANFGKWVAGGVKKMVDRVKNLFTPFVDWIKDKFGWLIDLAKKLGDIYGAAFEKIGKTLGIVGDDQGQAAQAEGRGKPTISPNGGVVESRRVEERRSRVDVNLNNLPRGSSVTTRGRAPGVTTNLGFAGAGG
jgi:hypothetical protein